MYTHTYTQITRIHLQGVPELTPFFSAANSLINLNSIRQSFDGTKSPANCSKEQP